MPGMKVGGGGLCETERGGHSKSSKGYLLQVNVINYYYYTRVKQYKHIGYIKNGFKFYKYRLYYEELRTI